MDGGWWDIISVQPQAEDQKTDLKETLAHGDSEAIKQRGRWGQVPMRD